MSTTIDERVVEMRFDNKQFESNVQTSMSTLDKLKQSLNLPGAAKGLEGINAAAKNVDMSVLSNGVETVRAKFSALEVMGVTALANITNSAVNAGKRMISALTIDPVKTGFSEYELKMDSIRTIMASTDKDVKEVNKYLKELNEYSDQTIYSFSDMTTNIGKFTNAGVELEDAVLAIKGISNEAAVSGASAAEASRAMYNFSQALSAGYVKLIDWKSIENANMATKEFKEELIESAVAAGTLTEAGDGMYKTVGGKTMNAIKDFNDSLKDEWMTTEVLIKTLGRYADETTDIGKKAFAAAQDVTKFTQMFDVLKETAQSGWAQTWETIIGDIDQAKALLTPLTDFFSGIINAVSDYRNTILAGALGNPFSDMFEKVTSGLDKIKNVTDSVKGAVKDLEYFQDVVNKVWNGDYNNHGDNPDRYDLLDAAGYDHRVVQSLVNLGYQHELTVEEVAAAHEKFGLTMEDTTANTEDMNKALQDLTKEELKNLGLTDDEIEAFQALQKESKKTGKSIEELANEMSNMDGRSMLIEGFKNIGKSIKSIFKAVGEAWTTIFPPTESIMNLYNAIKGFRDFSKNLVMSEDTADDLRRTLQGVFAILDIIATIAGGGLKIAFKLINALLGAFDMNILDVTAVVGDAIVKFRDWIDSVLDFKAIFEKIVPVCKNALSSFKDWVSGLKDSKDLPADIANGILSGLKKATKAVGKAGWVIGKTIWNGIESVLNKFGIDTSGIANSIHGFIERIKGWFVELRETGDIPGTIFSGLISAARKAWNVIDGFLSARGIDTSGFTDRVRQIANSLKAWIEQLKTSDNIPRDIILGLIKGLKSGVGLVWSTAIEIGKAALNAVKSFLGIHSPSTEFLEIGKNIIQGLVNGIKDGVKFVWDALKTVATTCINIIKEIDLGAVFAAVTIGSFAIGSIKLATAIKNFSAPFAGIGELFEGVSKATKAFSNNLNAQALKTMAIAILMLVGAIVVLTLIKPGKLWNAVAIIGVLAGVLIGMSIALGKFGGAEKGFDFAKLSLIILSIGGAMLLMAIVMKIVGGMDPKAMGKGFAAIGAFFIVMELLILSTKSCEKGVKNLGTTILKIATAMLLMVIVIKIVGKMDNKTLLKGGLVILAFVGIIALLALITKIAGSNNINNLGKVLLSMSGTMIIMAIVVRMLGGMKLSSLAKGVLAIGAFALIIIGLVYAVKAAGKNPQKLGATILAISFAIGLLAFIGMLLSLVKPSRLYAGVKAIAAFALIIAGLIFATKLAGDNADKLALTILAISVAIGILAFIAVMLSMVDKGALAKGIVAVGCFAIIIGLLIASTKNAKSCVGNLIMMAIVMGLLAGIIIVLSKLNTKELLSASFSIGIALLAFAGAMKIISNSKAFSLKMIGSIGVMILVVAALGVILGLLNKWNLKPSMKTVLGLSVMLLAMASAMVILDKVKSVTAGSIGVLALIGLVVLELGLILGLLNKWNLAPSISTVTSLSVMLLAMSDAMLILDRVKSVSAGSIGVLALMGLVVLELGVILGLLNMWNLEPSINTVMALSVMLLAMSAAMVILSMTGSTSSDSVGALALMGLVILELGVILGLLQKWNLAPSMDTVLSLSVMLLAMSAALVILTVVGAAGAAAYVGVGALVTLITAVGGLLVAIGALMTECPKAEEFLDKGIPILEKIGNALGSFFGNIIGGFLSGIGSGLSDIATSLSDFMSKLGPFLDGSKNIDPSSVEGIKALAETILILTAAELLDGITSFITGGSSIASFAEELPKLGEGLKKFSDSVVGIDNAAVTAAAGAAKSIAEMTSHIPNSGGVVSWFTGENSISKFANELPVLGAGLLAFSASIAGINPENVTAAANAAKSIAEMTSHIPNSGGVVSWFTGDNSLSKFASELPALGAGLLSFSLSVSGINPENVTAAAGAAKTIAEMTSHIPNSGGVASWFTGDNSISKFASELPALGMGLLLFSTSVSGINNENVVAAAGAAKSIAEMTSHIPNSGGVVSWFTGENSISKFASELPALGDGLLKFSNSVSGINNENVVAAANAAKSIAEMTNTLPKEGGIKQWFTGETSIANFADKLPALGEGLKKFSDSLNGMNADNVTTSVNAAKSLADMTKTAPENADPLITWGTKLPGFGTNLSSFFKNVSGITEASISTASTAIKSLSSSVKSIDTASITGAGSAINDLADSFKRITRFPSDSVDSFCSSLKRLSEVSLDGIISNFKNSESKMKEAGSSLLKSFIAGVDGQGDSVKKSGKNIMANFASGVTTQHAKTAKAFTTVLTSCLQTINASSGKFKSAGRDLVKGFASGISENTYRATAKARAMAKAAADAAEDELDINSPSKVFRKIGMSVPEGFAIGVGKLGNLVDKSATSMADIAIDGVRNSISRIADLVNTDIDSQPTIRPVVDLSNVESGANAIGNLLNLNSSVGVLATAGSVSGMMNRRSQNGTNSDVISAINKLGKDVRSMEKPSYTINGITYDDGSNVATAVESLVRAARIERRV